MATAIALIKGALLDLNALAAGQTPSGEEGQDCLTVLNQYRDWLGLERATLYATVRTTKTLAASTTTYTIGSGGSINIARPNWITRAGVVIDNTASPSTERPIRVMDDDEYAAWPQKALTGSPLVGIWYNHGNASGLGTISVLPVPDVSTTDLVLYTPGGELATFADLSTDYTLVRGMERALRKNLAVELAPMFRESPSPLLYQQAKESLAALKRASWRVSRLRSDPGLVNSGHAWDINSDSSWRP